MLGSPWPLGSMSVSAIRSHHASAESVKNTNRLLRQYFPRGIDMSTYSQAGLSAVARQLNERSRKTLQYQTPAKKFGHSVATTR